MRRIILWKRMTRRSRSRSGSLNRGSRTIKKRKQTRGINEMFGWVSQSASQATSLNLTKPDEIIPAQNMRDISVSRQYDPRIAPKRKSSRKVTTMSVRSLVRSILSDPDTRSSSQKRTLRRFARELELHLMATKSLPNQCLMPSPSTLTASPQKTAVPSLHTINEFLPFRAEFKTAGLAVTSKDQRGGSNFPPTPPRKDVKRTTNFDGGTKTPMSRYTGYTMSSEHTVLAFTPYYEKVTPPAPIMAPAPAPARTRQRSSHVDPLDSIPFPPTRPAPNPRKSLPWLPPRTPPATKATQTESPELVVTMEPRFPSASLSRYIEAESPQLSSTATSPVSYRSIDAESHTIPATLLASLWQPTVSKSPKTVPESSESTLKVRQSTTTLPRPEKKSEPVPEPTKRSPPTRTKVSAQVSKSQAALGTAKYMCKKAETALPPIPMALPEDYPAHKAIFRGLHVATAAAYDEEVDQWIQSATGYRVREFLGGLGAFEGLEKGAK